MGKRSRRRRIYWPAAMALFALSLPGCPASDPDDRFCITIDRRFASREEEELLRAAENTYPPREDVIAACIAEGQDPELLPEGPIWWYGWSGEAPLPYAITEGAVLHFKHTVEAMRDEALELPVARCRHHAQLVYAADIAYHDSFDREGETYTDVYAVAMRLSWDCGTRRTHCGFVKDRIVLLTTQGELVAIFGDGLTAMLD